MTVKTYPTMNERIVGILRWNGDPTLLYAAQRIEELEQINHVRDECLEIAIEALQRIAGSKTTTWRHVAARILFDIEARLAELETEKETE